MSGKEKAEPDSIWDHYSSYFLDYSDDYKESSILNQFGWNIPQESSADMMSGGGVEPVVEASASNPSVSSTSSDEQQEKSTATNPPPVKRKKKGQKRVRQARFAFVTKSEVDHLEDGYRWRKYGQKAVKNSPFPRSYYRCTNGKCMVKKRIERSSEDPSVVITTYEGQHCHHSAGYPRGALIPQEAAYPRYLTTPSNSSHSLYHPRPPPPDSPTLTPRAPPGPGEGLLGDIVPPRMRNNNG